VIATVTLNPALDRIYFIDDFQDNKTCHLINNNLVSLSSGGKGINVSVQLSKLDTTSVALGFIGQETGRLIEKELLLQGITTNFVRIDGRTRTSIFVVDSNNQTVKGICEHGPEISKEDRSMFLELFEKNMKSVDMVFIGGKLIDPLDSKFYAKLIRIANNNNVKTLVLPNEGCCAQVIKAEPFMLFPDIRENKTVNGVLLNSIPECIDFVKETYSNNTKTQYIVFDINKKVVICSRTTAYVFDIEQSNFANLIGLEDAIMSGFIYAIDKSYSEKELVNFVGALALEYLKTNKKYCSNLEDIMQRKNIIQPEVIAL
jgi:tagatose 6-phosphate kinase